MIKRAPCVSLDVDDTLSCRPGMGALEPSVIPRLTALCRVEPLRRGARRLVTGLRQRGCRVWIYTTSGRSPGYIRRWLLLHGIRVDGVVNAARHEEGLKVHRLPGRPSKYPPAFGIDLHVDDSEGVGMEGTRFGFRVVVVRPDDERWTEQVFSAVDALLLGPHVRGLTDTR